MNKKQKVNSKKKAKYLNIIILRAQFALIHSALVVSLKYIFFLQQRIFFSLSTQMSVSRETK